MLKTFKTVANARKEEQARFNKIKVYKLGKSPALLTGNNYRAMNAKRSIMATYEDAEYDASAAIVDLLDENEMEFTFHPVEDTLTITKTETGYEARYLVLDDYPQSPTDMNENDPNLFLVNYHRDFDVRKDDIIRMEQVRNYYQGDAEDMPEEYYFFKLSMLSHSGIRLALDSSLDHYYMGWDTSHVGLVCVSKVEWPEENKAFEAAKCLVEEWNQYLSGDVYGIVKETYNQDKESIDHDSGWGFYGFEYAKEALKTDI